MAKVYFNKFITLKKIVEEVTIIQLKINSCKNIYFYGTIRVHDEGIVHRDLHSNILMLSYQNIKLANLGSSRRIVECPHGYFPMVSVYYYGKYLVDIPRFIQNQEVFVL
ncbi:hypothetical protein C1646_701355, partial [Rhizophagus diaphanus]